MGTASFSIIFTNRALVLTGKSWTYLSVSRLYSVAAAAYWSAGRPGLPVSGDLLRRHEPRRTAHVAQSRKAAQSARPGRSAQAKIRDLDELAVSSSRAINSWPV